MENPTRCSLIPLLSIRAVSRWSRNSNDWINFCPENENFDQLIANFPKVEYLEMRKYRRTVKTVIRKNDLFLFARGTYQPSLLKKYLCHDSFQNPRKSEKKYYVT